MHIIALANNVPRVYDTVIKGKPIHRKEIPIMNKHDTFSREFLDSYANCARFLRGLFHL